MSAWPALWHLPAWVVLGSVAVVLVPARACRAVAIVAAGMALVLAGWIVAVPPSDVHVAWVPQLGLELALGLGSIGGLGLIAMGLLGLVAACQPNSTRGALAGSLAIQAVAITAVLARDLGLLVACHGCLAPLVVMTVAAGTGPQRLRAAWAAGLYLGLVAVVLCVAVGLLAVAHHDATAGQWSFALLSSMHVLLPWPVEATIAGLVVVAAAILLGVWPLHGWHMATQAALPRGPAAMIGALRWLGFDLLLRMWLPLTPTAAAAMAPVVAWWAVLAAIYAVTVARVEPVPGRAVTLLSSLPVAAIVVGVAGQHHEGIVGAAVVAVALTLGVGVNGVATTPRQYQAAALSWLPVPGLLGFVGLGIVILGTARFAVRDLGGHAMWLCSGLAVAIAVAVVTTRKIASKCDPTAPPKPWPTWGSVALLWLPLVVAGLAPAWVLARIEPSARVLLDVAALRRCTTIVEPPQVPVRMADEPIEACTAPIRALERLQEDRR